MARPRIELTDPNLFGNDAAELEEDDIFESYKVERNEVEAFSDPQHRIRIARAYKGEGKSALLRLVQSRLRRQFGDGILIVSTSGPAISPSVDGNDSDAWTRAWKRQIFQIVASELGTRIGMAWSDDAISLVEEAERNGYKSRSIVMSILDRLKTKQVPSSTRLGAEHPEKVVQRYMRGEPTTWMLIDDVDQNFQNTPLGRTRIAALFTACRQIITEVPELRLRLAVRPNVWTTIKREFESLSHIEQYNSDLTWSREEIRGLLAQRIEGYIRRTAQEASLANLREDAYPRDETLIAFAFEAPMKWGARDRPPHVVLSTLSRYRPRWLVDLCKVSAAAARSKGQTVIRQADIVSELENFGRRRIDDTIAEFRAQCPEIEHLIAAFVQQPERYRTDELIQTIDRRILPSVHPQIAGIAGKPSAMQVAHFLFEIGFLTGRQDFGDEEYEHVSYRDNPSLLHAKTNVDQGLSWEVHPVFRQALQLRDAAWVSKDKEKSGVNRKNRR